MSRALLWVSCSSGFNIVQVDSSIQATLANFAVQEPPSIKLRVAPPPSEDASGGQNLLDFDDTAASSAPTSKLRVPPPPTKDAGRGHNLLDFGDTAAPSGKPTAAALPNDDEWGYFGDASVPSGAPQAPAAAISDDPFGAAHLTAPAQAPGPPAATSSDPFDNQVSSPSSHSPLSGDPGATPSAGRTGTGPGIGVRKPLPADVFAVVVPGKDKAVSTSSTMGAATLGGVAARTPMPSGVVGSRTGPGWGDMPATSDTATAAVEEEPFEPFQSGGASLHNSSSPHMVPDAAGNGGVGSNSIHTVATGGVALKGGALKEKDPFADLLG
jgi:hypothetical protein